MVIEFPVRVLTKAVTVVFPNKNTSIQALLKRF